jgi:hypothetical protein
MYKIFIMFTSLLFLFIGGCASKQQEVTTPQPKEKPQAPFAIRGEIQIQKIGVFVLGESNLKPGTKLTITCQNKRMGETTVKKNGEFYFQFDTPEFKDGDQILIILNPDAQAKKLQAVYGENGENLNGPDVCEYTKDGSKYKGLKAGIFTDRGDNEVPLNIHVISSWKTVEYPMGTPSKK